MATQFYIDGLGLTRDPYMMTGPANMWVNVGRSQFHLPTGKAQVLRGHAGVVLPNREAVVRRLERLRKPVEGTQFGFSEHDGFADPRAALTSAVLSDIADDDESAASSSELRPIQ
jgi:hypothetical protein